MSDHISEMDVYRFAYNEKYLKDRFDSYHCFDGQLIVKNGVLVDTYWASSLDNRRFTLEEALAKGDLTFICNLNDVAEASYSDRLYYDEKDFFNLSHQHGCYKRFAVRKGAVKSAARMEEALTEAISECTRKIQRYQDDKREAEESLKRVQNGETEGIYIYD